MSNIGFWSPIADQNNNPPPDGCPESMPRNTVNNTMREMMGASSRMFRDQNGGIVSGGSGGAYAITSTGALAANPYTDYDQVSFICFEAHVDSTVAPTLSIDNLAPLPLVFDGQSTPGNGDVQAGTIVVAQYNPGNTRFEMLNARRRVFDLGTRMTFQQNAVPSGWSKITTYNDMGLRVVGTDPAGAKTDGLTFSATMTQRYIGQSNLPYVDLGNGSLSFSDSFSAQDNKSYGYSLSQTKRGVDGSGGSTVVTNVGLNEDTPSFTGSVSGNVTGNVVLDGDGNPLDFEMNRVDVVIGQAL